LGLYSDLLNTRNPRRQRAVIALLETENTIVPEPTANGWTNQRYGFKKQLSWYFPFKNGTLEAGILYIHDKMPLKEADKEKRNSSCFMCHRKGRCLHFFCRGRR